jgi:hypothetical protein
MNRRILNGWKQISGHIERSVRTAQRWEAQMGMPVHRPALKDSGVVVAFTDELDNWICRTTLETEEKEAVLSAPEGEEQNLLCVLEDMSTLVWDTEELAFRMRRLQEQLRQSLRLYRRRFAAQSTSSKALVHGQGMSLGSLLTFPAAATDRVGSEHTVRTQAQEPYIR